MQAEEEAEKTQRQAGQEAEHKTKEENTQAESERKRQKVLQAQATLQQSMQREKPGEKYRPHNAPPPVHIDGCTGKTGAVDGPVMYGEMAKAERAVMKKEDLLSDQLRE